ncbi:MAG: phytanoyl-CoA dioxygenase family protein [Minwuiales bacterium]|nr:phytanoyl-CoA dioxygenase family protein [Minwuiales bacterium]
MPDQSLSMKEIGDSHVEEFRATGFTVLRGAFDAAAVATLDRWTEALAARPEEPGRHWVYREASQLNPEQSLICRIENIVPFDADFRGLDAVLKAPVAKLLGEEAVLFKDKINFKLPGGDGFKAHQDAQAGWNVYAGFYITVMVSIDASTVENGCLELVGGRHREGLLGPEFEPLTGDAATVGYLPYPTEPGDVVFFDSYTPHRSMPNHTAEPRRVLYWTYNRLSEGDHRVRYFEDKHKNYPPDVEREANKTYVFRV